MAADLSAVMPGLVPGIHVLAQQEDVDGRDEPGHDESCKASWRQA
jgi:hypothetical protein